MIHKYRKKFISYPIRTGNDTELNIILKVDEQDLLRIIDKDRSVDYQKINLSIMVKANNIKNKTEKILQRKNGSIKLLREVESFSGNNSDKRLDDSMSVVGSANYTYTYNLITLRSKVNKIISISSNVLINKSGLGIRREGTGREEKPVEQLGDDKSFLHMNKTGNSKLQKLHEQKLMHAKKTLHVKNWNSVHFIKYITNKYKETYGYGSMFINGQMRQADGKIKAMVSNNLIKRFNKQLNMNNDDVLAYIDWVFDVKSSNVKFPVNVNLLCSGSFIDEWLFIRQRKMGKAGGKRDIRI